MTDKSAYLKVDPKAWFTNERTFLHWLNMAMIISAASLGSVSSIGFAISFVSFSIISIAVYKYATRYRELTRGVTSEIVSDFLDIRTPVFTASVITLAVVVGIIVAIHNWEVSRYS